MNFTLHFQHLSFFERVTNCAVLSVSFKYSYISQAIDLPMDDSAEKAVSIHCSLNVSLCDPNFAVSYEMKFTSQVPLPVKRPTSVFSNPSALK